MLITKSEVKHASKKLLSVLLAVIMIMSSLSVCFGTFGPVITASAVDDKAAVANFVTAANEYAEKVGKFPEFDYAYNSSTHVKTWTYNATYWTEFTIVCNVIDKLHAAIMGLDEYTVSATHNNNKYCGDGYYSSSQANKCTDWGYVKDALISVMGTDYKSLQANAAIDNLLDAVLNYKEVPTSTSSDDPGVARPANGTNNDGGSFSSSNSLPAQIWNDIVINAPSNAKDQILAAAATIADIPAGYTTQYYYRLGLQRCNQYDSEDCQDEAGTKFHMAIQDQSDKAPTTAPKSNATATIDKSSLEAAQTAFGGTYKSYFATTNKNEVLALSSSDAEALTEILADIKAKKAAVVTAFGESGYTKYLGSYAYDSTVKHIEDALVFLGFQAIINEIDRLMDIDYSDYSSTELAGHLAALETAYNNYKKLDDDDKADILATYPDFKPADVEAKIAEINAAYTRKLVEEKIDDIRANLDAYENKWTIHDVDNDILKYTEAYAAYILVDQDYNTLKNLDKAVIAEIAGADFYSRIEALHAHLAELSTAANYNELYTPEYQKFNSTVKPAVPSQDTENLLSALKNYDSWYSNLKVLLDEMSKNLSEETAEILYDEMNTVMTFHMENAYAILNGRVETQINIAYDLYEAHKAIYGPTVHYVSLESYQIITESIGLIDVPAYEFIKTTPNFTIDPATVTKYNELQKLLFEYDKFAENMGFDTFYQVKMADIEREDTIDDNFRQNSNKDEDPAGEYITTDDQIAKIIKVIDTALTNADIADAIGLDLGTMLTDLVEGAILSDSFINTVVNMLYPLVLKEFGKVFANDLPEEASGQKVTYNKGLHEVFSGASFAVYPDLLATELGKSPRAASYTDTINRLNAAYADAKNMYPGVGAKGNDAYLTKDTPDADGKYGLEKTAWDSQEIRDENGTLNLTWGIDAAKEAGTTGDELKELFYQTFDDAVEGLKPLLLALIANKSWFAEQTGLASAAGFVTVDLELSATANSGYANLLVPVYEALGVPYTSVSDVETVFTNETNTNASQDAALIIKAILEPIFTLVDRIGKAPLDTILGILPNLCYALEAKMVIPLLSMLKTTISYLAPVSCNLVDSPTGSVPIDVGSMLDIPIIDDIDRDGINALFSLLGIEGLPEINQALIACLGELTTVKTERKEAVYSLSKLEAGYAYHVVAHKEDVLAYLAEYLLTAIGQPGVLDALMGLLGGGSEEAPEEGEEGTTPEEGEEAEDSDLVTDLLNNISKNPKAAIAAIVELFNFSEYETQMLYGWFNGANYEAGTVVGFNPATEIYLDVDNDWTKEKALYLYNNLETIINAVIAMLPAEGEEADAPETVAEGEEVEVAAKTLSTLLNGLIGDLFTDETLTSLAALLGKLDLNALLAKEEAPAEGEEEATEEEALDINALIEKLLGIDLGQFAELYGDISAGAEDPEFVYDFGVNAAENKKAKFVDELVKMLAPLNKVLDFLLTGGDLTVFDGEAQVTLYGSDGYNTAIIPLLEALGCAPAAAETGSDALRATLNALVARIDALIANPVDEIFDLLPGLVYFLTSNGLSTFAQNLLKPALVVIETVRPIIDVMDVLNNLKIGEADENGVKKTLSEFLGSEINLKVLNANFVIDLVSELLGLNLTGLKAIFYDVAAALTKVDYPSASTLQTEWKTAEYNDDFDQADLLTVLLSFVVEWIAVPENGAAIDKLAKKEGIGEAIANIIKGAEFIYATPDWLYYFKDAEGNFDQAKYEEAVANGMVIPSTLAALKYPNNWNKDTAAYIAENLPELVDMIIGLINADKTDDDGNALPTTLSALLADLIGGVFSAETLNKLIGMIAGLLENVSDELLAAGGYLLNVDLVGLKGYTASEEIDTIDEFASELATVLTTYAPGIVELLFFGGDYRFFNTSEGEDSLVISGGNGYAEGLALILEALGCENLPVVYDESGKVKADLDTVAVVEAVFASLAARINAVLANPVEEVLELLPNLIYFLNANGAGVAVGNLLKPVNALLDSINAFLNKPISIADLIKIKTTDEEGNEVELALNLEELKLANVVEIVEAATKLDLTVVEDILVDFCVGKIASYDSVSINDAYKMTDFASDDVVTIILTIALIFIQNEDNAAALNELIGDDIISAIKIVLESAPVVYKDVEWYALDWDDVDYESQTVGVVQSALSYPNDWSEEMSLYLADNLPKLADMVVGLIEINGVKYESLAKLIEANVNIYTPDLLETIQNALGDLLGGLDANLQDLVNIGFGAADKLLGADIQGLLDYDVSGVKDKETFVAALTGMLMEVEGLVDWLLLGQDYEFFVDDKNDNGEYDDGEAVITLNGGEGYAQGLSLILEALGVAAPAVIKNEKGVVDTEATVNAVLTATFDRVEAIFANPVKEVIDILPNVIYFINANGLATAVYNLAGAFNALAIKLKAAFDLDISLGSLVDLKKILKLETAEISLDNLTLAAVLDVVAELTGLDLTDVADIFVDFALGRVQGYTGVNGKLNAKMIYDEGENGRFNKGDMITLVVTAALLVISNEDNVEKLNEMIGSDILSAINAVFAPGAVTYSEIDWEYPLADNGTVDVMKYSITYPNDWTETTAKIVTDFLDSKEFDSIVAGLIDSNYKSIADLLNDKVNVFTSATLDSLVGLITDLLDGIDAGLVEAAGVLIGADIKGLREYKAPEGINTVDAFADELTNVLTTYASGIVEWLLLGGDYTFFVNDANGDAKYDNGEDIITINGAHGYAEGLAVLLEALGCENLPEVYGTDASTEEIVAGVLDSVANRIDEIFNAPVKEVIDLLPNILYFLNTDGVAVVIDNLLAGVTALLAKLEAFDIKLNINELVNLKKLMGIEDTDATISLDNLRLGDILQAVSYMIDGLDLTLIEDVIVGFALGTVESYDSVSAYVGEPKKMVYATEFDRYDMVTVLANIVLLTVIDKANEDFVKGLVGEDIYKVITSLLDMGEAEVKEFSWMYTDKVGETFTTMDTSELFGEYMYGPSYTEAMAQYIADNFGKFVDNILYLLGLEIAGISADNLTDLINGLLNGSLYSSTNVIAIRDALAGVLAGVADLEVGGAKVGGLIAEVLVAAEIADINAVAEVNVPEFSNSRELFVTYLCDVLEPLYGILKYVLANEDLSFFVDLEKNDLITLKGGEGYAYGIIPLLEVLGCENIMAPDAYYAAVEADGDTLLTSILNPLLDRVDVIVADPAEEILEMLPNLIYFINSNGLDTVVKNTLNSVYSLLSVIEPIAKIDLYDLIGIDLSVINFEWLIDKLLEVLSNAGYEFEREDINFIAELTLGTLEEYTSTNGKQAYRMVFAVEGGLEGGITELVTVVLRLIVKFIAHEQNQALVVKFLENELGMAEEVKGYVEGALMLLAECIADTKLGMDAALASLYYIFYGVDTGVDGAAGGVKDLNKLWQEALTELKEMNTAAHELILEILGWDIFEDIIDQDGIAPNGFIKFFQKIIDWLKIIIDWFKSFFSKG